MKLFVLPGISPGNKEWEKRLKKDMPGFDLQLEEWPHWATGNEADFSVKKEAGRLSEAIGQSEVDILAKSVGTVIAMLLINKYHVKTNKIILCGIPMKGFRPETGQEYKDALSKVDQSRLQVFQNSQDPWGTFVEVRDFMASISRSIVVIEKQADNHAYPYPAEFIKFLS